MRNPETDKYVEQRFGKPDFLNSFYDSNGFIRTPLGEGKLRIWRIDTPMEYRDSAREVRK